MGKGRSGASSAVKATLASSAKARTAKAEVDAGNAKSVYEAERQAERMGLDSASLEGLSLHNANTYVKGLAILKQRGFPLPKAVSVVPDAQDVGARMTHDGRLLINPNSYSHTGAGMEIYRRDSFKMGWHSTASVHGTTFHETGHFLHQKKAGQEKYFKTLRSGPVLNIHSSSEYGRTNQAEAVAEGFARLLGGSRLTRTEWSAYKSFGGYRPRDRRRVR